MKLNSSGYFDDADVIKSGLPLFRFDDDENNFCSMDLWTYTDLKEVLKITLSVEERERLMKGFYKANARQRGWSGLYSFHEIVNGKLGLNIKYTPSGG